MACVAHQPRSLHQAPAIIFIDEIDAMGGKRGRVSVGSNSDRQTLNQLLACMDGFQKNEGIIVIGTTGVRFLSLSSPYRIRCQHE